MRFNTIYLDLRYPFYTKSRIGNKSDFSLGVPLAYILIRRDIKG